MTSDRVAPRAWRAYFEGSRLLENELERRMKATSGIDLGDFNVLLGAPANWAPQYDESQMQLDEVDQLWKIAAELPAGSYSFKIAINRSWDENYGAFGHFDGANHEVHHRGGLMVIQYDHRTKDIVIG